MVSREQAYEVLKKAIDYSPADETEIVLQGGKNALTRFANNHIHQNVFQKDYRISVRTVFGKRVGVSSLNMFQDNEIKRVVDSACEIAKHQKENPEWAGLPGEQDYPAIKISYDMPTVNCAPEERASAIQKVVEMCEKKGLISAGTFSTGDKITAVMNSKGIFCYHCSTNASFTLTVMAEPNGSGWSEQHSSRVKDINPEMLAEIAIEKAINSRNPITIEPGKYTVILEEHAVANLVRFLCWLGFGALSVQEGRSFMTNRFGDKITGENITIIDDAFATESLGMPFDFEGVAKQRVPLIENGIAKNVVYDCETAFKDKRESTGHALPAPNSEGPIPINVMVSPGNSTKEEMIASTDKGILVTRFWYDNVVDPRKPIITGMTRDGTFLIEKGKITKGIRNLRYNESILDTFSRVEAISNKLKTFHDMDRVATPAMKILDFNFTGVTSEV